MTTEIRGRLVSLGTPDEGDDAGHPRAVIYSTEALIRDCKANLFNGQVAIVAATELDALREQVTQLNNERKLQNEINAVEHGAPEDAAFAESAKGAKQ